MEDKIFTIGEVVKITGFTHRTIRYYGELGLVEATRTSKGHTRCYSKKDLKKFLFVKRLKDLGFPLEKVKEFLVLNKELKSKHSTLNINALIVDIIEKQLVVAQEKAYKYTQLSNLLEEMLIQAKQECPMCKENTCDNNCFSNRFIENYQILD